MLVLASASPRRRELLKQIGVPHSVHAANVDETKHENEAPHAYVHRLALQKAKTVAQQVPEAAVLAADTTVVLDSRILNKPRDLDDAERMLRALAERTHKVHTAIALCFGGTTLSHIETTEVSFTSILGSELDTYLATDDSLDKAGAYGIQGYPARWVRHIEGDYYNVVGLPLAATVALLRKAGLPV